MIHIIRWRPYDDSILSRKARYLVNELGWSIGERANSEASLNYSFPYLDGRSENVPYFAYFTHREDCLPDKVAIWVRRAQGALLRITSAQKYYDDLIQYGPTVKILPPLDRDKFSPGRAIPRYNSRRTRVGVAGYVYQGGRKGEALLMEMVKRFPDCEFVAMGKGWPVPTVHLPFADLQNFYHNIDIFLCTSLIEGVPYPPLEALACGVRVVIPRDVGLLDELPDIPGIERYETGDVNDMAGALKRAKRRKPQPEELRAATEKFSPDTWVEDHAEAVGELEEVHRVTAGKKSSKRSDRGIYVVAIGDNARRCAVKLLNSINSHMPEIEVAIVSDKRVFGADHHIEPPEGTGQDGRLAKIKAYELTPSTWKQAIYLDADTELNESLEHLFWSLEQGWEMVLVKDANSRDSVRHLWRAKAVQEYNDTVDFIGSEKEMALAGGVWAFKRCAGARNFLKSWQEEWGEGRYRDQPAMLRAFYNTKVRALILGSEWNSFTDHASENRFHIITHHSGGAARAAALDAAPYPEARQVLIVNVSKRPVERGGLIFFPNVSVLVNTAKMSYKEIKACPDLVIKDN